ncbi:MULTISPECIES: hypothetical protein [unclassified Pseudomonas]|uniref:hypothetical protein n=1 Tax=unclassified Pseudomonas TaxID=196821 RepID=UPI0008636EEF|nr:MULTISPECIES: hypothetical protein [unclassified Pseudomonas]NQD72895.1 hypothetical protein [Pseudomonas sp. CM27]
MSLAGNDKLTIGAIIKSVRLVQQAGYLKDAGSCAGQILYENYEYLIQQSFHRNLNSIPEILRIVKSKRDKDLIRGYLHLFFPVYANEELEKCKPKKVEEFRREETKALLIDFELYKRLTDAKVEVTFDKLNDIRLEVRFVTTNWKAYLESFLKWPTTDAPASLSELVKVGWIKAGLLSHFGYHVGMSGQPSAMRINILDKLFNATLTIHYFDKSYLSEWAKPSSLERLMKMARTIAALCRNAKRSPGNFTQAICDWEEDLEYLHRTYYKTFLNLQALNWPET